MKYITLILHILSTEGSPHIMNIVVNRLVHLTVEVPKVSEEDISLRIEFYVPKYVSGTQSNPFTYLYEETLQQPNSRDWFEEQSGQVTALKLCSVLHTEFSTTHNFLRGLCLCV